MKPFDNFCQALFASDNNWRKVLFRALAQQGIALDEQEPPGDVARRYVEQLPESVLLELLYRYTFHDPENVFTLLAQYKNAHPERAQFVNEFLQNADDAGAGRVVFEFTPSGVNVMNNGRAFSHENLYAICSFHESDKGPSERQQIGKYGMGFKTVFRISAQPEVYTFDLESQYRFAFRFFEPGDLDRHYHDQLLGQMPFDMSDKISPAARSSHHEKVGYVLPVPLEGWRQDLIDAHLPGQNRGSLFCLPLRWQEGEDLHRTWSSTSVDDLVPADVFLFLENIRSLQLVERRGEETKKVTYSKGRTTKEVAQLQVGNLERIRLNSSDDRPQHWLLLRSNPIATKKERFGDLDRWDRERLPDDYCWTIAVRLDKSGKEIGFVDECQLLGGKVYAFLPVKNPRLGLNFHVNAPFNLTNNRADLSPDLFNKELIRSIAAGLTELLDWLASSDDDGLRTSMHRLLPFQDAGAEVFEPLRIAAIDYRESRPFLPAHDGNWSQRYKSDPVSGEKVIHPGHQSW